MPCDCAAEERDENSASSGPMPPALAMADWVTRLSRAISSSAAAACLHVHVQPVEQRQQRRDPARVVDHPLYLLVVPPALQRAGSRLCALPTPRRESRSGRAGSRDAFCACREYSRSPSPVPPMPAPRPTHSWDCDGGGTAPSLIISPWWPRRTEDGEAEALLLHLDDPSAAAPTSAHRPLTIARRLRLVCRGGREGRCCVLLRIGRALAQEADERLDTAPLEEIIRVRPVVHLTPP